MTIAPQQNSENQTGAYFANPLGPIPSPRLFLRLHDANANVVLCQIDCVLNDLVSLLSRFRRQRVIAAVTSRYPTLQKPDNKGK
jgi:hypothetical protein